MCHWCSLFYTIKKQTTTPIWRNLLSFQNEAISLVAMRSKEWDWLVQEKSCHCQTCLKGLLVEWKFIAKAEVNCEIKENAGKIKSVFDIRAALQAKKLGCCLEYCRSWKNTLEKRSTLEAIWFKFWIKGALATMEICVLCGWWISNQFDIVSETRYSCNTVGRCGELYFSRCSGQQTGAFASESEVTCLF